MLKKIIVTLLIILVFVCLEIYDYHSQNSNEGGSPISKFLGDYHKWFKKRIHQPKSEEYRFDSRDNWNKLITEYKKILNKREKLISKRKELLKELKDNNEKLRQKAKEYTYIVNNVRKQLLGKIDDFNQIADSILYMCEEKSPYYNRKTNYNRIKSQITSLFEGIIEDPVTNLPSLDILLKRIEGMMIGECSNSSDKCHQDNNTKKGCSKQTVSALKYDFEEIINEITDIPLDGIKNIDKMVTSLNYEIWLLDNNFQGTDKELDKIRDTIHSQFKIISQEFLEIKGGHLIRLMNVLKDVQKDQGRYIENIKQNRERLLQQYKRIYSRIQNVIDTSKDVCGDCLIGLEIFVNDNRKKAFTLIKALDTNEKRVTALIKECDYADIKFIDRIAEAMDINLERMMEDKKYADEQKETTIKNKVALRQDIEKELGLKDNIY